MSQLDDMQRTLNRVVELLERLTGQQLAGTGGVTHTDDGMFLPGTGRLGATSTPDDEPDLPPATPADARAALAAARAERTAQLPQETPTT